MPGTEMVRIFLKSGAIVEFESEGFHVQAHGKQINILQLGNIRNARLEYINNDEIVAVLVERRSAG